jgi:hypothetical protein
MLDPRAECAPGGFVSRELIPCSLVIVARMSRLTYFKATSSAQADFSCRSARAAFDVNNVHPAPLAVRSLMIPRVAHWAWLLLLLQPCSVGAASSLNLLLLRKQEPHGKDVPLEQLSDRERELAKHVLTRPAFTAKGPSETFFCNPEHYQFFLDHPHKAVTAWRKLGAKCVSITSHGEQKFGWSDGQGSEVVWETIHRGAELHIWYAEGKVRPGPILPLVPVKALVVMRHKNGRNADGATQVEHQADLYVQTDSKTAAVVTRMLGPASQRIAEQGMGQLQLFFAGLSWYLDRHPDRADLLLGDTELGLGSLDRKGARAERP